MKINNVNLSFRAGLVIDNKANNENLNSSQSRIIRNFNKETKEYPKYTMFWRFEGDGEEDRFELYDDNSKSVAMVDIGFSNIFDYLDDSSVVDRLNSVFNLLKLKEFYNKIINKLNTLRSTYLGCLNDTLNNPSLSEEDKTKLSNKQTAFIQEYSNRIASVARMSQIECSSYMLANGLADAEDEL